MPWVEGVDVQPYYVKAARLYVLAKYGQEILDQVSPNRPGPATLAMLDLMRELVDHPRGSEIGIAKITMQAFLAELGHQTKETL